MLIVAIPNRDYQQWRLWVRLYQDCAAHIRRVPDRLLFIRRGILVVRTSKLTRVVYGTEPFRYINCNRKMGLKQYHENIQGKEKISTSMYHFVDTSGTCYLDIHFWYESNFLSVATIKRNSLPTIKCEMTRKRGNVKDFRQQTSTFIIIFHMLPSQDTASLSRRKHKHTQHSFRKVLLFGL